jgi:hypothetical protein
MPLEASRGVIYAAKIESFDKAQHKYRGIHFRAQRKSALANSMQIHWRAA